MPRITKPFHIYGLDIGQEENVGIYRTYHYDRCGSTIALTDNNGKITDSYRYSLYGFLVYNTVTPIPFFYKVGAG